MSEQLKDQGINGARPLSGMVYDHAVEHGIEPTPEEFRAVLGMFDGSVISDEADRDLRFAIITSEDCSVTGQPYSTRNLVLLQALQAIRNKQSV